MGSGNWEGFIVQLAQLVLAASNLERHLSSGNADIRLQQHKNIYKTFI